MGERVKTLTIVGERVKTLTIVGGRVKALTVVGLFVFELHVESITLLERGRRGVGGRGGCSKAGEGGGLHIGRVCRKPDFHLKPVQHY